MRVWGPGSVGGDVWLHKRDPQQKPSKSKVIGSHWTSVGYGLSYWIGLEVRFIIRICLPASGFVKQAKSRLTYRFHSLHLVRYLVSFYRLTGVDYECWSCCYYFLYLTSSRKRWLDACAEDNRHSVTFSAYPQLLPKLPIALPAG